MITEFDTETATLVLPVSNIDYDTHYRMNANAGSSTLIEIDFDTENFTQFYIDYSLLGIEDMARAKSHAYLVAHMMAVDILGCECNHTYKDAWLKELAQQEVA